jgi:hypothetical protein
MPKVSGQAKNKSRLLIKTADLKLVYIYRLFGFHMFGQKLFHRLVKIETVFFVGEAVSFDVFNRMCRARSL